jgi:hypothetical protein
VKGERFAFPLTLEGNNMASYFDRFFAEKEIPFQTFEVEFEGMVHFIDNETVIDLVKETKGGERKSIESTLRKIDFANGDVNHFLRHLAEGYVKSNFA